MDEVAKGIAHFALSCTECKRRKQKCNRQWPCDHCQKRKIAHNCRFSHRQDNLEIGSRQNFNSKRQVTSDGPATHSGLSSSDDADFGIDVSGYTAAHVFGGFADNSVSDKQYFLDVTSCHQLKRALQLLSPRHRTDSLVQNFFSNVNFHYYIIYPPLFLEEYLAWWSQVTKNRPLGLQWTCMLLMVCACSTQFIEDKLQQELTLGLGDSTQKLSEQYHQASRELHSVIPLGINHLFSVQSLLHSCYWYKTEGLFAECWHVLNGAILAAQELGFHQKTVSGHIAEIDCEMRRRVWCILNTWDWQLSALLRRPTIVGHTGCSVALPNLTLDDYSPSPFLHMKLQSELIAQLSGRFGTPRNVTNPTDVLGYQSICEEWMGSVPSIYDFTKPDKRSDVAQPWIVLHRHYLKTMSYSILLCPFKAYITKPMSSKSPSAELKIRKGGISYSLKLLDALRTFFGYIYPRDAKFYLVLFSVFDTAVILCSAIIYDQHGSLPRRLDILDAVDEAVALLKHLCTINSTAKSAYEMLAKVLWRIRQPTHEAEAASIPSRTKALLQESEPISHSTRQMEALAAGESAFLPLQTSHSGCLKNEFSYGIMKPLNTSPGLNTDSYWDAVGAMLDTPAAGFNGFMADRAFTEINTEDPAAASYSASPVRRSPLRAGPDPVVNFGSVVGAEISELMALWNYEK